MTNGEEVQEGGEDEDEILAATSTAVDHSSSLANLSFLFLCILVDTKRTAVDADHRHSSSFEK